MTQKDARAMTNRTDDGVAIDNPSAGQPAAPAGSPTAWTIRNRAEAAILRDAGRGFEIDFYQANNYIAARLLIDTGRGRYRYVTQHTSGTTIWSRPEDDARITISRAEAVGHARAS